MKTKFVWSDKVPERDGLKSTVHDLAFNPDGTQLLVAAGNRVLIYDTLDGKLLHSLKGHKDTVYTVDFSRDGKRFASGGADKTIIIWTNKSEGILKYSHNDSIQKVVYNPATQQLASCTSSDFGLWSPEQKSVSKHKVSSKILSASWSNDGQYLALGMFSGNISIRDKQGVEKSSIERNSPVWALCWNPSKNEAVDTLAVGCWDKTLSFYQVSGIQQGKDRKLGFDPCSISFYNQGQYLILGGSDRKASLYTKDGVKLATLCECPHWTWVSKWRPNSNCVVVGCDDGSLTMHQLQFSIVHGLYQNRYAYRENMTDVIVQHLLTEQKVRIKCRDYIKKISLYRDRLAVQLSDRIIIYELAVDSGYDMHYKVRDKIHKSLLCNLLVVTSVHVILCQDKKLQQYNFSGMNEREWVFDVTIRYIKVAGGPPGREGLLVGLKNGQVFQLFIDNAFPIPLIKHTSSIRCLDLSSSRKKLAVVDEKSCCLVYDLISKELLYKEENAHSVAWNSEFEDMLCFAGNGKLGIKTKDFPVYSQNIQGFVVGFTGSKIFCLQSTAVQTIDVPQSAPLCRYLETGDYSMAYSVACLGVTETDWRFLATESLQSLQLEIARKSFIRIRDMRYIDFINTIEHLLKLSNSNVPFVQAEILAYKGNYSDAAKILIKAGAIEKAITMYTDLRKWEEAKAIATESNAVNVKDLVQKQAEWAEEVQEWKAAAEMYIAAGNTNKAIHILGERKWSDEIMKIARTLPKSEELNLCIDYLLAAKRYKECGELYVKSGDVEALMQMHIKLQEWDEALQLGQQHIGKFSADIFLPYAQWLLMNDRFDDALVVYQKAERFDQCLRMLEQMTHNAVVEHCFQDASYYFWLLAGEKMKQIKHSLQEFTVQDKENLALSQEYSKRADIYYAYQFVHAFTDDPFTSYSAGTLLNASRYIINVIGKGDTPYGISKIMAYEKLQQLHLPTLWMDEIEFAMMTIQSKPYSDKEDLLPLCFRCSTTNPLLSTTNGDACVNCGHEFIRSFASFDILPLVEFVLEEDITDEEALRLIQASNDDCFGSATTKTKGDNYLQKQGNVQTLRLEEPNDDIHEDDLFTKKLTAMENTNGKQAVTLDRKTLMSLNSNNVFIMTFPSPGVRNKYYNNMIPDIPIHFSREARRFFHEEDYELASLKEGRCPFSRTPLAN